MNRTEWSSGEDSWPMLRFLENANPTERKVHLFVCGCCRHCHWDALRSMQLQDVVGVAERFADGAATKSELLAARDLCTERSNQLWRLVAHPPEEAILARWAAKVVTGVSQARWGESLTRRQALWAAKYMRGPDLRKQLTHLKASQVRAQCDLLRDIFNPFPESDFASSWLEWNDGVIPKIARHIYVERRFDGMPVLADALEEAGCSETVILEHCRRGRHIRGCWVLDSLLAEAEPAGCTFSVRNGL